MEVQATTEAASTGEGRNRHERRAVAAHGESALWLTVKGFCEPRALPRSTFYKLVGEGRIRIVKRGRRSLVHHTEAERFDSALLNAA